MAKKKLRLFAYHRAPEGGVDYIGEVLEESETSLRVEVVDAVLATFCCMWQLSGNLKDLPKSECELFSDAGSCLESALRINDRIHRSRRTERWNLPVSPYGTQAKGGQNIPPATTPRPAPPKGSGER